MAFSLKVFNTTVQLLNSLKISIDPTKKEFLGDINIITHAHSDHFKPFAENSFTSKASSELIKTIYNKKTKAIKEIKTDDIRIKLIDSGHILGSSSILIDLDGKRILISGDINNYDTIISKGMKALDIDALIIESTYGYSNYDFRNREDKYNSLIKWIKKSIYNNFIPIIITHKLGKAQEAIKIINKESPFKIAVPKEIYDINKVYINNNIKLDNFFSFQDLKDCDIVIMPPSPYLNEFIKFIEYKTKKKSDIMYITAMLNRKNCIKLSSHSDFFALKEFIEACNPKELYIYHGSAKAMAKKLSFKNSLHIYQK